MPAAIDRKSPCPCRSGRRYKDCCYPRDRAREGALQAAEAGANAVDEVLRVFLPLVESRGEHRIACGEGCTACCNSFIRCTPAEGLRIARYLEEPGRAAEKERFLGVLPGWRERAGDSPRKLAELLMRHGGPPAPEAEGDFEAFNEIGVEYALRGNLCAFNHAGMCDVYEVRPLICRTTTVVETAEFCTPRRGQRPKVVSHPRLEEAAGEAHRGMVTASRGLGPEEEAAPEAVARAMKTLRGA